jgi:hypothetical protein
MAGHGQCSACCSCLPSAAYQGKPVCGVTSRSQPDWLRSWGRLAGARLDQSLGDLGLPLQKGQPQRPIHRDDRHTAFQPLTHDGDDLAVRGRLLRQRPGREQVQAGAQLAVDQLRVGAATARPAGEADRAHQHGEQAFDTGQGARSAVTEPAAVGHIHPR